MRILLTNDDGITAPGLAVLEQIAAEIAGPEGEVWIVAPAFEQSGVGHCISYTQPMLTSVIDPHRIAVEGSPADCVMSALHHLLPEPPDLVLSGVNRGNNAAENALYSGTIGGAMEAALQGLPAVALSQFLGPRTRTLDNPFEGAAAWGTRVVRRLVERADWSEDDYRLFYSVNFPPCPAAEITGMSAAPQGFRPGTGFHVVAQGAPNGRDYLWIRGADQQVPTAPGTDVAVNLDDRISITPMRADLTDHAALPALEAALV